MRYRLDISYDGSNYFGFQRQKNKISIQEVLEKVLSEVCRENITITASGRTDAGVSALDQVCNFDTSSDMPIGRIKGYANTLLPDDIKIIDISVVSENFNARTTAKRKTYEYYFYVGDKTPVYDRFATNIGYDIDIVAMEMCARMFVGTFDFSAFCASNTSVENKVRSVYDCKIEIVNDRLYRLSITGNGFLYNMVRIIMGTLVSVGLGKIKPDDIVEIIKKGDRSLSGKTMPARGLLLKKVEY